MISYSTLLYVADAQTISAVLGLVAGFLGVVASVYLQLVAPDRCRPRYVAAFFVLGSGLILINFAAIGTLSAGVDDWFPVVGNAIILAGELWAVRKVIEESDATASALTFLSDDERVR